MHRVNYLMNNRENYRFFCREKSWWSHFCTPLFMLIHLQLIHFSSPLRLLIESTLRIANDLPMFASYYAFVTVSLTWLAYFLSRDYLSYMNSLRSLFIFRFSLTKGQCSKSKTIYSSYWQYTDLFIFNLMFACLWLLNSIILTVTCKKSYAAIVR